MATETKTPRMLNYRGYKITVREKMPPVAVFDPRFKQAPAIYTTQSVSEAMAWIDAYVDGQQWAVDAANKLRAASQFESDTAGEDSECRYA